MKKGNFLHGVRDGVTASVCGTLRRTKCTQNSLVLLSLIKVRFQNLKFDRVTEIIVLPEGFKAWTYMKEIPNTKLLITLQHVNYKDAKLAIYDVSEKDKIREVYSFKETYTGVWIDVFLLMSFSLGNGRGVLAYNAKRNFIGALSVREKIAYHLFDLENNESQAYGNIKLLRKSEWPAHYVTEQSELNYLFFF